MPKGNSKILFLSAVLLVPVSFGNEPAENSSLRSMPAELSGPTLKVLRHSIAGGSGSSSGGYRLQGTLGQPTAGNIVGASFEISSGFWAPPLGEDVIFCDGFESGDTSAWD